MTIGKIILAVVGSVLFIDAIRYRIIYFKFKKLDIVDYREIKEYLDGIKRSTIPVDMKVNSPEELMDLENKMDNIARVISVLTSFNGQKLELLFKDLGYLENYYGLFNESITDLISEIERIKNSYNTIGGNDGSKEEGN